MPEGSDVNQLVEELNQNFVKQNRELFITEGNLRAGILVLINDTDWELEGEGDYKLEHNDKITFISTLHGG